MHLQENTFNILALETIKESQLFKSGNISIVTKLFQRYTQTKRYFPLLFDKSLGKNINRPIITVSHFVCTMSCGKIFDQKIAELKEFQIASAI